MSDRSGLGFWRPGADALAAVGWFAAALIARAPLVARIEGALDHDQSVVALMALDIAEGRRFPIFFDGQRYMGAVESYAAAVFVRALGHAPAVIALAPLLAFGLFAAGQYAVWARWRDRPTGHLAAALTVFGAPMLVLWGIIPRGGYAEFLAWALPALAAYRGVARPGRPPLPPPLQAGWGFLLSVGYFLNPLALTVYVTIALDWALGRHGDDLRRERHLETGRARDRAVAALALLAAAAWLLAIAACCHVDPRAPLGRSPYIAFGGRIDPRWGLPLGAGGVVGLLGLAAWFTRGPARVYERLTRNPWALVGVLAASAPLCLYNLLVRLGIYSPSPSLPVWITAPWKAGPNALSAFKVLGPLVGCDPRAIETVLIGQGIEPPGARWPAIEAGLIQVSPAVVALALSLVAWVTIHEWPYWARLFALRGDDVAPPVALATAFLAVSGLLYLLQGTSPNGSSVRYLIPVWVALPGLLSCGLRAIPQRAGLAAGLLLVVPWLAAQSQIYADLDRPSSARPLTAELSRRGVPAVVAPTPVALVVANLSHGKVGAVEYQAMWPRLRDRYRDRLPTTRPLTCVVDRRFPWPIRGEGAWAPEQDFGRHLRALADRHPGRVRLAWSVGPFDVWEAALPLDDVLALEPSEPATAITTR